MNALAEPIGLLPLSLQHTKLGKRYRVPVMSNEERLRAFRAHAEPVIGNAHPWKHTKASNEGESK